MKQLRETPAQEISNTALICLFSTAQVETRRFDRDL
jgi:hypothetical protein